MKSDHNAGDTGSLRCSLLLEEVYEYVGRTQLYCGDHHRHLQRACPSTPVDLKLGATITQKILAHRTILGIWPFWLNFTVICGSLVIPVHSWTFSFHLRRVQEPDSKEQVGLGRHRHRHRQAHARQAPDFFSYTLLRTSANQPILTLP